MEPALDITRSAASTDPDVGLRAVASLRALTERLEILQVENARKLGPALVLIPSHVMAGSASRAVSSSASWAGVSLHLAPPAPLEASASRPPGAIGKVRGSRYLGDSAPSF